MVTQDKQREDYKQGHLKKGIRIRKIKIRYK